MSDDEKVTKFVAIKKFFSLDGRPVTTEELKALSSEDKNELAMPCSEALGVELVSTVAASVSVVEASSTHEE